MSSESSAARTEQIVSQFLLKSLHVILSARIPHLRPAPSSALRNRDRWFNLALGDTPHSLNSLSAFPHRSPLDPLHLDLLLSPHDHLVERWSLALEPSSTASTSPTQTYKKSLLLLRSIYSLLRLLPAHRAFRMLLSPNHTCNFSLSYALSSFPDPLRPADPLRTFHFAPVDTALGVLSTSVSYRASLEPFRLASTPLLPPRIIPDYVGSPAADPFRAFSPSLPRPHSWTSPPLAHFPLADSPDRQVCRTMSYGGKRAAAGPSLSPSFSASPTPSPPLYPHSPLRSRLLDAASSPVTIPAPARSILRTTSAVTGSDLTRGLLPPPSPRSAAQDPSSEGRLFRKIEGFPSSLPNCGLSKGVKDVREESGRFSGILLSGNSLRVGVSRSSSRLSFMDDLDCEFPFAVNDIDTPDSQNRNPDGKEGPESSQPYSSIRKSQDAAVGVLVNMLKNAPPLRQDSLSSQSSRSEYGGDTSSSSLFISRKASDALEELRSYKEMKNLLLSQSGIKLLDSIDRKTQ